MSQFLSNGKIRAAMVARFTGLPYIKRQRIVIADVEEVSVRIELKGADIMQIPRDMSTILKFPPGHPCDNILYIGDPVISCVYYPAAQFHRRTFERKLSEAILILMSLGAIQIEVECVEGWSNKFAGSLDLSLSAICLQTDTKVSGSQKSNSQILFKATFDGARHPILPKDLAWYWHEPTWQQVASGRLKYGMKNFSLYVRYEDDFGVNADLKVKALNFGLNLGGRLEDYQSTVWRIIGEFGESSV